MPEITPADISPRPFAGVFSSPEEDCAAWFLLRCLQICRLGWGDIVTVDRATIAFLADPSVDRIVESPDLEAGFDRLGDSNLVVAIESADGPHMHLTPEGAALIARNAPRLATRGDTPAGTE